MWQKKIGVVALVGMLSVGVGSVLIAQGRLIKRSSDCDIGKPLISSLILDAPGLTTGPYTVLAKGLIYSRDGRLNVVLRNIASTDLTYRLRAITTWTGQEVIHNLVEGMVRGKAVQTAVVDLTRLGPQVMGTGRAAFSRSVGIEALVLEGEQVVSRSFLPTLYFHRDMDTPGQPLMVYLEQVLQRRFGAGDLQKRFRVGALLQRLGLGPEAGPIESILEVQDVSPPPTETSPPADPGPGDVGAVVPWEFCVKWNYFTVDKGAGESDYANTHVMEARGVKLNIVSVKSQTAVKGHANKDTGCFTAQLDGSGGFLVQVYAEAKIGQEELRPIYIRTFQTDTEKDKAYRTWGPKTPGIKEVAVAKWVVHVPAANNPHTVNIIVPQSWRTNLMAIATYSVYKIERDLDFAALMPTVPNLPLGKPLTMDVLNPPMENADGGYPTLNIGDNTAGGKAYYWNNAYWQFIVSHEVGHWFKDLYAESLASTEYDYPDKALGESVDEKECLWKLGTHALRSLEYSRSTFNEGLSHFLSAYVWNTSDGSTFWWRYYKTPYNYDKEQYEEFAQAAYQDMIDTHFRVNMATHGGAVNFKKAQCPRGRDYSIELDWLRFFWAYLNTAPELIEDVTPNPGDLGSGETGNEKPSLQDFMDLLAFASAHDIFPEPPTQEEVHDFVTSSCDNFWATWNHPELPQTLKKFKNRWMYLESVYGICEVS